MTGEAEMLIKKADVKKYFAEKRRKYNSPLTLQSAASAHSFSSIKAAPAPAVAVAPVSRSKSS
jgi:hypothetical protein